MIKKINDMRKYEPTKQNMLKAKYVRYSGYKKSVFQFKSYKNKGLIVVELAVEEPDPEKAKFIVDNIYNYNEIKYRLKLSTETIQTRYTKIYAYITIHYIKKISEISLENTNEVVNWAFEKLKLFHSNYYDKLKETYTKFEKSLKS